MKSFIQFNVFLFIPSVLEHLKFFCKALSQIPFGNLGRLRQVLCRQALSGAEAVMIFEVKIRHVNLHGFHFFFR